MSTTSGNMKTFKVTDQHGNQYIMIPVDTEAHQVIWGEFNLISILLALVLHLEVLVQRKVLNRRIHYEFT